MMNLAKPIQYCTGVLIALTIGFLLAGCSKHGHRISADQKSKFVSELIDDSAACHVYKSKLTMPIRDEDDVDVIFRQAIRAHCVKKDV